MFTGIVETTGRVRRFEREGGAWRLELEAEEVFVDGVAVGDSVAVNGCCLTAIAPGGDRLTFDLLEETVRRTTFSRLTGGQPVNLERSLRYDGRVGGHFVTGHVDCFAEVDAREQKGSDVYLHIAAPAECAGYLAEKGSIAVDGVSLTVAGVDEAGFGVWLIPHTLETTTLGERTPGALVNLEFDLLAKYVERILGGGRT